MNIIMCPSVQVMPCKRRRAITVLAKLIILRETRLILLPTTHLTVKFSHDKSQFEYLLTVLHLKILKSITTCCRCYPVSTGISPIHCPNGRLGEDLGFSGFAFALKLPELLNRNLAANRAINWVPSWGQ